jgi:hypothetical protein
MGQKNKVKGWALPVVGGVVFRPIKIKMNFMK